MKGLLYANLPEKLAALVIAVLLWQVVLRIEQPMAERSFESVPVEYINKAEDLVKTQGRESIHVDARIIGPDVNTINKDEMRLIVDLSGLKAGQYRLPVRAFYDSEGVSLLPRPKIVEVVLEPYTSMELEVKPQVSGTWDLYRPGSITVSPPKVTVSGSESALQSVAEARAEISLAAIEPGAAAVTNVQLLSRTGKLLSLTVDPKSVTVLVKPVPLPPEKTVLVQPAWVGTPEFGYEVERYEIFPNQVKITGANEQLYEVSSVHTLPINLSGVSESKTVTARLELPPGVRSDTEEVQVRLIMRRQESARPGG